MNARLLDELKRELQSRGFDAYGTAPKDTMTLDDAYLSSISLGELFDMMIARPRESLQIN